MWRLNFALCVAVAALPSWLKVPLYRAVFGYQIGRRVRIGFSPFFGIADCRIGDDARIGHLNLFFRVERLELQDQVRIGFLNLFRGGRRVTVGRYATIIRQNVFNSIIDQDFDHEVDSVLELGPGSTVASGHWLDFSARISVGAHSIIAGRNSSFWSHFRQKGTPIRVGDHCYLGSDVRVAPGGEIPSLSIVALGSVVQGPLVLERSLIGGNPASVARLLADEELRVLTRKTRADIPDEFVSRTLPATLAPTPPPGAPR